MYSMVMVMAMSGSAALPASCFGRCQGSCSGAVACSGSCSGSCNGSRCSGGLFSRRCSGSCSGVSSCSGSCSGRVARCSGSCNGSCSGRASCSGSCSGSRCFGGLFSRRGCHGSCSGSCHGVVSCTGCTGGCHGTAPAAAPAEPKKAETKPPAASLDAPAKVLVSLPADATLTIDGHATTSTSAQRTFVSPTLEAGKEFTYTLKVEMVRDGKTMSDSKVITVRAGETTEVSFDTLTVASN